MDFFLSFRAPFCTRASFASPRGRGVAERDLLSWDSLSKSAPPSTNPRASTPGTLLWPSAACCYTVGLVPPLWVLTTSTAYSALGVPVYCTWLPTGVRRSAPQTRQPKPLRLARLTTRHPQKTFPSDRPHHCENRSTRPKLPATGHQSIQKTMFIHPSLRKGLGDEATPVLTEELRGVPRFRHVCGELGRHLSASDASARRLCGSHAPRAGLRQRQSVNREPFEGLRQCLTLSSKPDEQTAHLRSNQSRVPHLPVIAPTSLPRCRSTEREARLCPDNHPGETECSSARARRASPPRERSASTPKVAEPPTRHLPWAFEPQLTCMLPDMRPISRDDTPVPSATRAAQQAGRDASR